MSLTQVSVCLPHGGDFLGNFHFWGKMGVLGARGQGFATGCGGDFFRAAGAARAGGAKPRPYDEILKER